MTRKILFVGDLEYENPNVIDWLLDPVRMFRKQIEQTSNCILKIEDCKKFDQIDISIEKYQPDILFYSCLWNTPVEEVKNHLQKIRSSFPDLKIIFFDHCDQSSSPFFAILNKVDLFVKMMLYKDLDLYRADLNGNYIVTDYMHKNQLVDLNGWEFGSKVNENQAHKLMVGWNLSTMNSLSRYSRYPILSKLSSFPKKINDVMCRLSLSDGKDDTSYYSAHRRLCMTEVLKLNEKYKIIHNSDGSKVKFTTFINDIRKSRLAVSPFGWGEITDRDFRIANHRALLVKPDMSHLTTAPDIYVNGETYAAVKWDFSNLEEVCDYYLSRPKETKEIVENAAQVLADFYKNNGVVNRFNRIVERVLTI